VSTVSAHLAEDKLAKSGSTSLLRNCDIRNTQGRAKEQAVHTVQELPATRTTAIHNESLLRRGGHFYRLPRGLSYSLPEMRP